MIRFGTVLTVVIVALGLLVAGVLATSLLLVYVAIGVAALAAVLLVIGAVAWRRELFGPGDSAESGQVLDAVGAGVAAQSRTSRPAAAEPAAQTWTVREQPEQRPDTAPAKSGAGSTLAGGPPHSERQRPGSRPQQAPGTRPGERPEPEDRPEPAVVRPYTERREPARAEFAGRDQPTGKLTGRPEQAGRDKPTGKVAARPEPAGRDKNTAQLNALGKQAGRDEPTAQLTKPGRESARKGPREGAPDESWTVQPPAGSPPAPGSSGARRTGSAERTGSTDRAAPDAGSAQRAGTAQRRGSSERSGTDSASSERSGTDKGKGAAERASAADRPGTAERTGSAAAAGGAGAGRRSDGPPVPAASTSSKPAKEAPPARDSGAEVTIVPGIARYHRGECILIRFLSPDDVQKMTLREAEETGCAPCKACRPEQELSAD